MSWLTTSRGSRTSKTELVVDIETHGDNDFLHPQERPLVCVGLYDGHEVVVIPGYLLDTEWPELIEELKQFDIIAHNGKFDLVTLCSQLGDLDISLKLTWDTMLMHYVLWPASNQGLKVIAKQVLGVDDWETFEGFGKLSRASYPTRQEWFQHAYPAMLTAVELGGKSMEMTRVGDYHPSMVHLYNAYDVYYTYHVWKYVKDILDMNEEATRAYNHLIRFSNWIGVDETKGFTVDLRKTNQLRAPYVEQVDQYRRQLMEWAHDCVPKHEFPGGQFNPNSWQQVLKVYESVGVDLPSTNEKTMSELVKKGDKFAEKLLEYRSAKKLVSTYLDRVVKYHNTLHGEPRMYPEYRLSSTVTGRLSSSGPTNIQNWPTQEDSPPDLRLRTVYVPSKLSPEGTPQERVLAQIDYSQAELRVAAALSADEWLTGIFSDPSVDIFTQMTSDIFPHIEDEEEIKRWRRPLKSVVYGLMFGRGADAVGHELGIGVQQARLIMNTFLTKAKGLAAWREEIMRACIAGTPIVTRFGRHFHHEVVTNRNKSAVRRSALSFLPQSTSSDIMLTAYMDMRDHLATTDLDWRFRALVHDAVTWDIPVEEAEACIEMSKKYMLDAAARTIPEVPFAVDGQYALTWSDT